MTIETRRQGLAVSTPDDAAVHPGCGTRSLAKCDRLLGELTVGLAHAAATPGTAGLALRHNRVGVLRNRRLNQLILDVALDGTVDDLERTTWDRE